jgi:hypothetical protein
MKYRKLIESGNLIACVGEKVLLCRTAPGGADIEAEEAGAAGWSVREGRLEATNGKCNACTCELELVVVIVVSKWG